MSIMSLFLLFILSITELEYSSSTSIVTSSIGSNLLPSELFLNITRGRETDISKPSLLIVSIRTPNCNSPLPPISNESLLLFSLKVIATLVSASFNNLCLISVEVTLSPSRPANGDEFTEIFTDIVGGSMGVDFKGILFDGSVIVSDTDVNLRPAIQIISPALTFSTGIFSVLSNLKSFVNLPFSIILPSRLIELTLVLT